MPRTRYLVELRQSLDRDRGILLSSLCQIISNFLSMGVILITNIAHVKIAIECFLERELVLLNLSNLTCTHMDKLPS